MMLLAITALAYGAALVLVLALWGYSPVRRCWGAALLVWLPPLLGVLAELAALYLHWAWAVQRIEVGP